MAAKHALSSLHQRLWSSGCAGCRTRGWGSNQRQTATDLKEWDFSPFCFVCCPLHVRSRRTRRSAFDVGGRGCGYRPQRQTVRCVAEIKGGRSPAGLLSYTQQTEVITHMGGTDFMTSWWNNGDVSFFSAAKTTDRRIKRKAELSLNFTQAEIRVQS